jgi:prevent-host-death family protein
MPRQVFVSSSEGHRVFGKLLQCVSRSDEHLIIKRRGSPVAVLLPYREYERLRQERALVAFEQLGRALSRDVARQGLDEDELIKEIRNAKRGVYDDRYGQQT